MTQPKIMTTRQAGARWYVHPDTGDKVPGVTSVINMLPKPYLAPWNAKMVAEEAVLNFDAVKVIKDNTGPDAAIDYLKGAARRYTKKAADIGSAAHAVFEQLALGHKVGAVTPEVAPFVAQFRNYLDTVQPEYVMAEETVWSDQYGYGGSFDAIARIDGELCIVDNKTSKSAHAETALQLAAYAHGDYVLHEDGTHTPVPTVTRGLIVHVRPERWALYELPIDAEVFAYFLNLRKLFEWSQVERKILGKPLLTGAAA